MSRLISSPGNRERKHTESTVARQRGDHPVRACELCADGALLTAHFLLQASVQRATSAPSRLAVYRYT
uniref:Uncharacterized protein n=1 Tax=Anguilla anguilla TaxID=7936 RepID=A0A0E9PS12_ANGAN